MSFNLRRRTLVRIISFLTAAALSFCGLFMRQSRELRLARQENAYTYLRAFDQLTASVDRLDAALEKCIYATGGSMLSGLSSQVYAEALGAQQALGELPYANIQLEETAAFVAKTGDYAMALSRSAAEQDGYDGTQLAEVKELHKAAVLLKERLHELEGSLYDGTSTLETASEVTERLSALTEQGDILAGSSFQTIEAEFPELPTLVYDGPFSHHLQSRSARLLEGQEEISLSGARDLAAKWLGLPVDRLNEEMPLEGELPCWVFSGETEEGSFSINVTKQGGQVVLWGCDRPKDAPALTREEAVRRAKQFLDSHGVKDCAVTYTMEEDNCLIVTFGATQGEILLYPDLIKVKIALDSGNPVGYEAAGWVMNHCKREDLTPAVSKEAARKLVSAELTVVSEGLTVIPTNGEYEVLCWEFKCENGDGVHYLVYVNAKTGKEQKILRLIEDERGTLAE